ncbi:MAG: ornithine carbamoyltransferase [Candidatus Micrarchaeota archaeon]
MNFLSVLETTEAGINGFLQLAQKVKAGGQEYSRALASKALVMLFEKSSTRTRISFDVAASQLGGHAISLDFSQIQASRGESIADTARALSVYADCIIARLYKQEDMVELEKYSGVPVINGQTDEEHPCQALSDLLTMKEHGKLGRGKVLCYIGDANRNVANSLIVACAKSGMEVRIACPPGYEPRAKFLGEAKKFSTALVFEDAFEAVKGADVVYTDRWSDKIGEEDSSKRATLLAKYRVDSAILEKAAGDCILMHPLPANRGMEIASECLDGEKSVVWEQAKNRLHMQKAILLKVLGKA